MVPLSTLVSGQDRPDGVQLPVLAQQMQRAQLFRSDVPDPHGLPAPQPVYVLRGGRVATCTAAGTGPPSRRAPSAARATAGVAPAPARASGAPGESAQWPGDRGEPLFHGGGQDDQVGRECRGRLGAGPGLSGLASLASFLVSRVDTEIDRPWATIGSPEARALLGRAGLANGRLGYMQDEEVFATGRAGTLMAAGACPQAPVAGLHRGDGPGLR